MNVKCEMRDGRLAWITLPKPIWTGSAEIGTGLRLHGLYLGARTGRMVAETYSQWTQQNGCVVGTEYTEITPSEWIKYCDLAGVDPGLTPEDL